MSWPPKKTTLQRSRTERISATCTTVKVPYDKQVPGLPAQSGAGGGYMAPSLVGQLWNAFGGSLKGLMTWSINWDGSPGWTFGDNVKSLQGR